MKLAGIWTACLVFAVAFMYAIGAAEEFAAGWNEHRLARLRRRRAA